MLAYKAFHKDLVCRGYRFHYGVNITDQANCVKNGFHCARNPIDCFRYYPNASITEFCLVDAGGDIDEDAIDSKISCTELNIIKRLTPGSFLLHCLLWLSKHAEDRTHPLVNRNNGEALNGYAIIVGRSPVAKGKNGDFLALLQIDDFNDVIALSVLEVGKNGIESGVYYDVFGRERSYV